MNRPIREIQYKFYRLIKLKEIIAWSKQFTLPGFSKVPLYDVILFIYKELQQDDLPTRANSVAFSFFLSIFPFIIFVLPLLSITPWADNTIREFETSMDGVFPQMAKDYLMSVIDGIKTEGNYKWQSTGFLLSILFASSGMLTLMYGFDKSYDKSFKSRNYFQKRLVALNLTILFAFIIFLSVVLIILGNQVLDLLIEIFSLSVFNTALFVGLKWIVVIMLFYSVITVIYRYGPSTYKPLKWINPGATLATFSSLLCSVGFSYFINNFSSYNEIYGTIGALIVLLLWLQINAFIILAGFELNASIIVNRDKASTIHNMSHRGTTVK